MLLPYSTLRLLGKLKEFYPPLESDLSFLFILNLEILNFKNMDDLEQ